MQVRSQGRLRTKFNTIPRALLTLGGLAMALVGAATIPSVLFPAAACASEDDGSCGPAPTCPDFYLKDVQVWIRIPTLGSDRALWAHKTHWKVANAGTSQAWYSPGS